MNNENNNVNVHVKIATQFYDNMPKYFQFKTDTKITLLELTNNKYCAYIDAKTDRIPQLIIDQIETAEFDHPADALANAYKVLMTI